MSEDLLLEEEDVARTKRTRGTSGTAHPYFDLESSIKVAEVIRNRGGDTAQPDQLALWLDYKSTKSGTYVTRVNSARHFGLISISGSTISITERARRILAPVMPDDVVSAKAEAFLDVQLFGLVYEQFFGGTLPPESGLKNLFESKYKILPDRIPQAVRVFLNSADQAGFLSKVGDVYRLVKPAVNGSRPSSIEGNGLVVTREEAVPPERTKIYTSAIEGTPGVHSAIIGLLRELPPPGSVWNAKKKQRFLDAFKANIDFIYPDEES